MHDAYTHGARRSESIEVGELGLIRLENALSFTYAVWARDSGSTLLPVADVIAFSEVDGERRRVPWARAARAIPELNVHEPELSPPRVRVGAWPERAIQALKETNGQ